MRGDLLHLLVVDDSPTSTPSLEEALRQSSPAALTRIGRLADVERVLARDRVDCALLVLPAGSDLGRVSSLTSRAPDLPIVVLAPAPGPALGRRAIATGAQDVLAVDEVTPEVLHRTVVHAVARAAMVRERLGTDPLPRVRALLEAVQDRLERAPSAPPDAVAEAWTEVAHLVAACHDAVVPGDQPRLVVRHRCDLTATAQRALSLLGPELADRGALVDLGPLPEVAADPESMLDLLMLLLRGALAAAPDDSPRISLAAVREGPWGELQLVSAARVTGPGGGAAAALQEATLGGPLGSAGTLDQARDTVRWAGGSLWTTVEEDRRLVVHLRLPLAPGSVRRP